jgi:hypothetical protein
MRPFGSREDLVTFQAPPSETNISAVGGRLAFLAVLLGLLYAAFFPSPRLFASTHVAHFAGFYMFTLGCTAAAKRVKLIPLGFYIAALAVALELARTMIWLPLTTSYLDWIGDMAGVVGALAPMLLQKVRSYYTRDAA